MFGIRALLVALAVMAPLSASSAGALTVGIGDQNPGAFDGPHFDELRFTHARYVVPYDVTTDPRQRAKFEAWLAGATRKKQVVMVAFEHSRKNRRQAGILPGPATYTSALKRFKAKYGTKVAEISAWNEANRRFDPNRGEGQPTWNRPDMAARYYGISRKVFPGRRIVALNVLDERDVRPAVRYIRGFNAALRKQGLARPAVWGLHPYSDINRFSTTRTKALLKEIRGGEIWITEASGIVRFGSNFPYDEKRAAAANRCMFTIAKLSSRITRLYHYGFAPTPSFDSGIVNDDGSKRPGFEPVRKRQAGPCRRP